jgi:hypothetical protein
MFQIISGTSKTVSGTQNLERNVPNTAHTNVASNSVLLGTLFLLVFPVSEMKRFSKTVLIAKTNGEIVIERPAKKTRDSKER